MWANVMRSWVIGQLSQEQVILVESGNRKTRVCGKGLLLSVIVTPSHEQAMSIGILSRELISDVFSQPPSHCVHRRREILSLFPTFNDCLGKDDLTLEYIFHLY